MSIDLNHIIIYVKDKWASAEFLAGILGREAGPAWGAFVPVRTDNGVTIDFAESANIRQTHCAFLVGDAEFDAALARLKREGVKFFAEHDGSRPGEINTFYGGRGFYFSEPSGHLFELITRPYGDEP